MFCFLLGFEPSCSEIAVRGTVVIKKVIFTKGEVRLWTKEFPTAQLDCICVNSDIHHPVGVSYTLPSLPFVDAMCVGGSLLDATHRGFLL